MLSISSVIYSNKIKSAEIADTRPQIYVGRDRVNLNPLTF